MLSSEVCDGHLVSSRGEARWSEGDVVGMGKRSMLSESNDDASDLRKDSIGREVEVVEAESGGPRAAISIRDQQPSRRVLLVRKAYPDQADDSDCDRSLPIPPPSLWYDEIDDNFRRSHYSQCRPDD